MRVIVLLVALLAAGGLTGCMGLVNNGDEPGAGTTITPAATGGNGQPLVVPPALPFLKTKVEASLAYPSWVPTGTTIDVSAAAPADAKAPLTWTWLVGPMLGTAPVKQKATGLDTGSKTVAQYISPGGSATLTFGIAGVYQMHCHPHYQFMRSNVTVIDGLEGPMNYDVYIEDGGSLKEFRYVPENITVPKGAHVTYHNVGSQAHTASLSSQDAELKLAPLKAQKGSIALAGNGWTRVVAFVHDADGRIGQAEFQVFVAPYPEEFRQTYTGNPQAGVPASADGTPLTTVAPGESKSFKLDYNGTLYLNLTAVDPVAANAGDQDPANTAQVEVHLREQGATQDTLSCTPAASVCKLSGRVLATTYNLLIVPRQGASITYTAKLESVYDHVPPAPSAYVDPESLPHTH